MISIIIPTYNESSRIAATIKQINESPDDGNITEIIVADAGSIDATVDVAKNAGAETCVLSGKNRSAQLNAGATIAKGSILFFLHADSVLPDGYSNDIVKAMKEGFYSGCFRLAFDHDHWFLKFNAWFTRFNVNAFRFGDQGLFVVKDIFLMSGGYDERLTIMEDQEIIHRIRRHSKFRVIPKSIVTSTRKYLVNGIYKTQGIFYLIWLLYYLGVSQAKLINIHRKLSRKEP
jgi:rSAM/selenodomain-associated transferase 2